MDNKEIKVNIIYDVKEPISYEMQVQKIREKGFIVEDNEECEDFLKHVNYYRFLAYLLPFKNKDGSYTKGIEFRRVKRIYVFDSKIRELLFVTIEDIEIYLRTILSNYYSNIYGTLGYLEKTNFNDKHNHEDFIETIDKYIERNSNSLIVKHHKEKYGGKFPLWVIIEFFSIGSLSYFYSDLKTKDKKKISFEYFDVTYECLRNWLSVLTKLRNRCAHFSRLYFYTFNFKPAQGKYLEYNFNKTLFSQIYLLKQLYPSKHEWNAVFLVNLEKLIKEYESDISLKHIGFPPNWKELLSFKDNANNNV